MVDDEASVRALLGTYLEKHGFTVYLDESAESALATYIKHKPAIDVMVLDVMMARMNGWELLDYVRKDMGVTSRELPVIVMSAVEGIDLKMEYIRHDANDWITKPIRPMEKLVHKINILLGRERRAKP